MRANGSISCNRVTLCLLASLRIAGSLSKMHRSLEVARKLGVPTLKGLWLFKMRYDSSSFSPRPRSPFLSLVRRVCLVCCSPAAPSFLCVSICALPHRLPKISTVRCAVGHRHSLTEERPSAAVSYFSPLSCTSYHRMRCCPFC